MFAVLRSNPLYICRRSFVVLPLQFTYSSNEQEYPPASNLFRQMDKGSKRFRQSKRGTHMIFSELTDFSPDAHRLKISSYNILAQYLIESNKLLYSHCDSRSLTWNKRFSNISRDISNLGSDILCLQEIQSDHFEQDLGPFLRKLGYECEFAKKTQFKQDGCAVAYRSDRFSALDSITVNFNHSERNQSGCPLAYSNNVAQLVLLCLKCDPEARLLVATTHLFFSPNRGDTKLGEVCVLLAEIDFMLRRHSLSPKECPVVITGDFNSEPDSPLVSDLLIRGFLDLNQPLKVSAVSRQNATSFRNAPSQQFVDKAAVPPRGWAISDLCSYSPGPVGSGRLSHQLLLRNSHVYWSNPDGASATLPDGEKGMSQVDSQRRSFGRRVTSFTSADTCAVDYILYSASSRLRLIGHQALPTPQQLTSQAGLPNPLCGSDHIPISACFALERSPRE